VIDPRTGEPFTDDSAWNYVADLLDQGTELSVVKLHHPLGKNDRGFVMTKPLGAKDLYVKFQMGSCKIIGRSFHYSTFARN
jgi:hypothetical protein